MTSDAVAPVAWIIDASSGRSSRERPACERMTTERPQIEFLWWRGCPSADGVLADLRKMLEKLGLDGDSVDVREVMTDAEAERERFVGSPTIRVGGRDVQPPGPEDPVGLACRVYRLRDGRISPAPDPADVRDALLRAVTERS